MPVTYIDDEELEAIIDFQMNMIEGAIESGEEAEAKSRRERVKNLKGLKGK